MVQFFSNSCFFNIIVLFGSRSPCIHCDDWEDAERQELIEDFIPNLYFRYRKVLESSDEETITFRRVLGNNKEYDIHINKLIDVNGLKRHNLIIKEKSDDNPLIYVNNPVETKIPNAYLSLQQFKAILTGRVLRQREEFSKPHRTYATLKRAQNTKQNKESSAKSKIKNRTESKRDTKTNPIRNKLTLKNKKSPKKVVHIINKHIKQTTVVNSLQSKINTKIVSSKVTLANLIKTSKNTHTLKHNVSNTVKITANKPELSDTTRTITPFTQHSILRINAKETPKVTVQKANKSFTFVNITHRTNYTEVMPKAESSATPVMLEQIFPKSTEPLNESTIKEPTEIPAVEATGEFVAEDSTTEEPTTEYLTTVESTKQLTTTEKVSTKSKRITLARPLVYIGGWENGN